VTRQAPITDYYGTEITVEPLMASRGPMVDLEVRGVEEDDSPSRALIDHYDFFRLTPEQARELGERLIEAAESHG
jgi:hypothetical protein